MKVTVVVCSLLALASGAAILPPTTIVRAPQFDSAVIKSDRLGGNFAYSSHEAHAYAAVSPVVQNVISPVGVSYHATPIQYPAVPAVVPAYAPAYSPAYAPAVVPAYPAYPAYAPVHVAAPVIPAFTAPAVPVAAPADAASADAAPAPAPAASEQADYVQPAASSDDSVTVEAA